MKKKMTCLLLSAMTALLLCMPAFAASDTNVGYVDYTGSALSLNVAGKSAENAFSGILPGETRGETVTLQNNSDKTAIFYVDAAVLSPLESRTRDASGKVTAYTFDLAVNGTSLYSTDTAGGIQSTGMYILNEDLNGKTVVQASDDSNWIAVAQLPAHQSASMSFSMKLDGAATQNNYLDKNGTVQFRFMVRDVNSNTKTYTTTNVVRNVRNVVYSVQTGDYTPIAVLITILVLGFGMMYLLFRKKDDTKQKDTVEKQK